MGWKVKKCGCACKDQKDACTCASGTCSATCRKRAGLAQLIGYPEWTNVSTPPRLYRTKKFGGESRSTHYQTFNCGGNHTDFFAKLSGENSYDKTTGILTKNSVAIGESGSSTGTEQACVGLPVTAHSANKFTATRLVAYCCFSTPSGGEADCSDLNSTETVHCDQTYAALSEEDTEQDAIERLNPAWSAWQATSQTACTAGIEPRSGTQFSFSEVEVEVTAQGTPNWFVTVEVSFSRKPFFSGSFEVYYKENLTFQTGSDGKAQPYVFSVPSQYGYQTKFDGCKVVELDLNNA